MKSNKLILLIVVLPLVLALFAGWQAYRASGGQTAQELAEVEESLKAIRAIQKEANDPNVVIETDNGETYVASKLIIELTNAQKNLKRNIGLARIIGMPIAGVAAVFGLGAALAGGLGLLTIRNMGQKARASREALLNSFIAGKKMLPWLISAVGLLIAVAVACVIAYELISYADSGLKGRGDGKLMMFGLMAIGALLLFSFKLIRNVFQASQAMFEREPMPLLGRSVSEKEAPKVWSFVRDVAQKAGATMPDGIILGLDQGFFVTEHPVALAGGAKAPNGRILYLPLPYMAFMTRAETAAVVGHELGHFTGADTEYSLRFSPIYASAVNNLRAVYYAAGDTSDNRLANVVSKPAMLLSEFFLESFDHAVQHWSRVRELAADAVGAAVAGGEAIALSLLRISVLAPHIDTALAEHWNKAGEGKGIIERTMELVQEHGLSDPGEHLEDAQPHPTDSHPPVRLRLEALKVEAGAELLAQARDGSGSSLLSELGLADAIPEDAGDIAPGEAVRAASAKPMSALTKVIEDDFASAARENAEGITEELRAFAAEGTDPKSFMEGGVVMLSLYTIIGLVLSGVGLSAVLDPGWSNQYLALLIPLGLLMLAYVAYVLLRRRKPFLTLTKDGLLFANLQQPVPWTHVADYGISISSNNGMTTSVDVGVFLEENVAPPTFSGDRRVTYEKKEHRLSFEVLHFRGRMSADTFSEEFATYWRAGLARDQLETMK